jgi:SRSO17 transposase
MGRPPRLLRRGKDHQPVSAKQLALSLPQDAWTMVSWRQGARHKLRSRFAAVRIRPAHRDYWQAEPYAEEWLLMEWPKRETEPTKYWLSTLSSTTKLRQLVALAKHGARVRPERHNPHSIAPLRTMLARRLLVAADIDAEDHGEGDPQKGQ